MVSLELDMMPPGLGGGGWRLGPWVVAGRRLGWVELG